LRMYLCRLPVHARTHARTHPTSRRGMKFIRSFVRSFVHHDGKCGPPPRVEIENGIYTVG
jgi:hypothetical protein